jgi:sarcosine oxidase subunit gamma
MVEPYLRQSALAKLGLAARAADADATGGAGVRLCEHGWRGQINLRGESTDAAFLDAVERVAGVRLPGEPNTSTGTDDLAAGCRALWLGPDEWLLTASPGEARRIEEALRGELAGHPRTSVVDVGDARTVISVAGANALDVLMKGCGIDLDPAVFVPGRCAQSLLARASVILHRLADDPGDGVARVEIYVARSFAEYLWAWIEDAASEYGVRIVEA